MMSYDEYKAKVYDLFIKERLVNISKEKKIRHLEDNEDVIQESYTDAVYAYEHENRKLVFTDFVISDAVGSTLEMLY